MREVPVLARWFQLAVWNTSLLTTNASVQMSHAADLLLVVFIFEWAMWSLLFNSVIYFRPLHLGWLSPGAAGLGLLFAWAVFVWEKSVITADLPSSRLRRAMPHSLRPAAWRKVTALGTRCALIIASAMATAQSLELFIFNGAIENRLRDESVLAESIRQAESQAHDRAQTAFKSLGAVEQTLQGAEVAQAKTTASSEFEVAKSQLEAANSAKQLAQDRLNAADNNYAFWDREFQARQRAANSAPADLQIATRLAANDAATRRDSAAEILRTRRTVLDGASRRLSDAQAVVNAAASKKTDTSNRFQKAVEAERAIEDSRSKEHQAAADRRKAWLDTLQAAKYGSELNNPTASGAATAFAWKEADFLDRLRILSDLTEGIPPQWPFASDDLRKSAVQLFQIPDPGASQNAVADSARQASLFQTAYLLSYIVALIIPLLALGFKLVLIGPELEAYYSCWSQARSGNVEALRVLNAQGFDLDDL
jgi:hypothetical protein